MQTKRSSIQKTEFFIFRLTHQGWVMVRANLDTREIAEAVFNSMKQAEPKLSLRIIAVTETIVHEG